MAQDGVTSEARLRASVRGLAAALGVCLALLAVAGWKLARDGRRAVDPLDVATADPELRRRAMSLLMDQTAGFYDSHPDPDVGRVLQPGLEGFEREGLRLASNSLGMREEEYALPRPEGLVRVVLLGDSFVMGSGINREDRLGRHLGDFLRARAGAADVPVEVLHLGLGSWNVRAECAWLRRQLDLLQPALVVHVLVGNDLDDCSAVRGFGVLSDFSSRHRGRANSLLRQGHPVQLGFRGQNWLAAGLDHESRTRFAEAAADLLRLRDEVLASGADYLALVRFAERQPAAAEHLVAALPDSQKSFLPRAFDLDDRYRLSKGDPHWSPAGHERVAMLLYGLALERGWLDELALAPWPEATAVVRELHDAGAEEALGNFPLRGLLARSPIASELRFESLDQAGAAQIHGGIDARGRCSPYASLILQADDSRFLVLEARTPDRSALRGAQVRVSVEEFELTSATLVPGEALRLRLELPEEVLERRFLNVRLESSDYAYFDEDLRACLSLELERIALEP